MFMWYSSNLMSLVIFIWLENGFTLPNMGIVVGFV